MSAARREKAWRRSNKSCSQIDSQGACPKTRFHPHGALAILANYGAKTGQNRHSRTDSPGTCQKMLSVGYWASPHVLVERPCPDARHTSGHPQSGPLMRRGIPPRGLGGTGFCRSERSRSARRPSFQWGTASPFQRAIRPHWVGDDILERASCLCGSARRPQLPPSSTLGWTP